MLHSPGPILVDLGKLFGAGYSLPIRWYGLLTGLGFLVSAIYVNFLIAKRANEEQKQNLIDVLFWCFFGGIVGARLWFVALSWDYFAAQPIKIFHIWEGGQSIQGGFVGGILSGLFFYWLKKADSKPESYLNRLFVCDLFGLALPLAQAIGRWGNFFNTEAFGKPTNLPWGQFVPPHLRPEQYLGSSSFHPTFLYESIYLLFVAGFLYFLFRRRDSGLIKLNNGTILCIYFMLYSLGRFFLESMRTDSLYISIFPAAQVVCVLTFGLALLFAFRFSRVQA
ncbi:MAG: prolipoprotein diacylglyceryl transferase [Candidatus Caenarcaniphilales bacterium]|nr:prolipoprotein diacylglyceryl transferase [Candidatus Caenarcaniphilales bacterium]